VSIRTLFTREMGNRSIALVEVTEAVDTPQGYKSTGWDFLCDHCGQFDTGLSESDAYDALAHHQCPENEDEAVGQ